MKRAPVQGFSAGIPWDMHLRAYDVYCSKWGKQNAMIDLEGRNCRGGFSIRELDQWIPGWREELDERRVLHARIEALEQALLEIADQHIGDCPAALDISDEAWVRRCHDGLRSIARAALAQTGESNE